MTAGAPRVAARPGTARDLLGDDRHRAAALRRLRFAVTASPGVGGTLSGARGGIALQHRMAYQGEYFVDRYGQRAAESTPPISRIIASGVKVSAGTDATRVASYNPWVSLRGSLPAGPLAARNFIRGAIA